MDFGPVTFLGQAGQAEAVRQRDSRKGGGDIEAIERSGGVGIFFLTACLNKLEERKVIVVDVGAQVGLAIL
jgi:hypothetical protein